MLIALAVLPLAAFGGGDFTVALPFSVAGLIACLVVRPPIARGAWRHLDGALVALIVLIAFQLVPLPRPLQGALSPRANEVNAAIALAPPTDSAFQPLSLDPPATAWAALVTAAALAVFWMARHVFEAVGVRRVTRGIAGTGMAVSLVAIAQAATAGRNIYWVFPTNPDGPLPFGPFVNRNHFATWAIMAAPLCFGYIAARSDAHASPAFVSTRTRVVRLFDGRTVWLFACGVTILAALLLSLSRSGILALAIAGAGTLMGTRHRPDASRYAWFAIAGAAAVMAAVLWADIGAIAERIAAADAAVDGRVRIWRETLPMIRDFWISGTGAGTYQRGMLLYQQSDRLWYFNQAHNHYLQVAAEGGILVCAAVCAAAAAYGAQARRRLLEDRSGMFWLRAGALCGLAAVALQSVWETGLTMPANAVLAAILAAIAVHGHHRSDAAPH